VRRNAAPRVLPLALALLAAVCYAQSPALAATSGTFIAANCAPVAAASDGTMVWYSRNSAGVWETYIGNGNCQGKPLLAPYEGNRGPADITANGRYVLLTTAEGWERQLPGSSPGEGSDNSIQLYDRQTGRLSTLLAGATDSQRGVIWPTFNANATKIVWSQMVKTGPEAPPNGEWALHVADVDLETGTLSDNVEWQDPDGSPAFYEAYGWIPGTDRLIFMSTTRAKVSGFGSSQLFTLPEDLDPSTAPTRISPEYAPAWPWESPTNAFQEFAHFAPGEPDTLYTSIGADTVGGDDLFAYDLQGQEADGLLGQPTRISYFGGDLNLDLGAKAVPGWPTPSYTVVTTMAWVDGAWVMTTCPDLLCSQVNAWRINLSGGSEPTSDAPDGEAGAQPAPPPSSPSRPVRAARHPTRSCASSASTARRTANTAKRRRPARSRALCRRPRDESRSRRGREARRASARASHRRVG
jgi:hypothetical protein